MALKCDPQKLQTLIEADWEKRQQLEKLKCEDYGQPFKAEPSPKLHPDVFTFTPWGDRILVMREQQQTRTGGIIIPDSARGLSTSGWVISVGERIVDDKLGVRDCPLSHPEMLLGRKVIFGSYAAQVLIVSDDKFADNFHSIYSVLDIGSVWGTVGEPLTEAPW